MNIKVLLKWFLEKIKKVILLLTPKFKEDDSFWDKCTTVYLSIMCVLFIVPMAIFTIIFAVYLWLTFYFCNFEESCPNPEFWKKQEQTPKYEQVFKQCYEEKKLDGTITKDSNLEFVSKAIKDCIGDKDTALTNLIIPLIYAETMD
jgi:hypothetical protein